MVHTRWLFVRWLVGQLRESFEQQEQLRVETRDLRTALARERPFRIYAERVQVANRRLVVSD